MFIPTGKVSHLNRFNAQSKVYLEMQHICVNYEIAEGVFGMDEAVLCKYYPKDHVLFIAPFSDEVFKTLHKADQFILKNKNIMGDKSIAIHGLLLDNDIDIRDRDLQYEADNIMKVMKVIF